MFIKNMVRLLRLKGCGQMKKIKQPYLYIFLWILGLFLIASVILPQNTPPAAAIASNSTDIEILNNVLFGNWYFDEEIFEVVLDEVKDFVFNFIVKD